MIGGLGNLIWRRKKWGNDQSVEYDTLAIKCTVIHEHSS